LFDVLLRKALYAYFLETRQCLTGSVVGKLVRYGPNRLSLITPAASRDLHDVKANTLKADAYGGAKHLFSTEMSTTIIDHKAHAFRRRVNAAALTPTIVKGFADLVSPHVDYLLEVIGEGSKPAAEVNEAPDEDNMGWSPGRDMSHHIAYCVADMMGTITFGRSLNTQRDPTHRKFIKDSPLGVAGIHIVSYSPSGPRLVPR
jgi:hypothetical protein